MTSLFWKTPMEICFASFRLPRRFDDVKLIIIYIDGMALGDQRHDRCHARQ